MISNNAIHNKLKILLVEDVQADRILIARAINNTGFNCEIKFAENIEDALTLAFKYNFDCILLDYYYPTTGNGLDFIKTFQARGGPELGHSARRPSSIEWASRLGPR